MRITRLLFFILTFALFLVTGCLNTAEKYEGPNEENDVFTETDLEETTYQQQMFGSDLQAINEDFNAESVRGEPSFPKKGIISFNEQGQAVYDNEAVIDRKGMMVKAPDKEPIDPNQYRAFIRSTVNDMSQKAVYTDGRVDEISKEFYKTTDNDIRNITPEVMDKLQRDIDVKLEGAMDCYEVAGFNPTLQEYLGSVISALKEAEVEGDYDKYVHAVKKIQSLNGVINVK